ncbi:BQ2448_252 [Microbotryum intermedium]|uniref:BQ2448_252 protein n=1 Tax=Microbotryum intermedium TaxID=269621 RepID=A0A238F7S4_9BASI|nr:BQ2448_252 [Microbotryum intermedium]
MEQACAPASEVFDRRAKPLLLRAEVDEAILHLGGSAYFSPVDAKNLFGSDERIGWESCGQQPEHAGWLKTAISSIFDLSPSRRYSRIRGKSSSSAAVATVCDSSLLFPPYHLLTTGKTVADYKSNHIAPLGAFGIQSLAEIGVNGALAASASTYGIKYITVETFRDLIQMSHLLFGSASADGKSFDHWSSRIPAIVSLDLVSAFGRAIMWYWIFTLVAVFLVYEVFRFTGGWFMTQPCRAVGEGFDRVGLRDRKGNVGSTMKWRDSYAYRTTVTFLATSLYLPLSKIAIGSMVWSDDFWVVPDPFDGLDPPDTSALGDATLYYPRLDFCYRTTMRRRSGLLHFNFGWLIVPISLLTILWLTLFLPYRLFRLAQREAPSTDEWTETGERRTDVDGEYARLLERDRSPFSFLYRGKLKGIRDKPSGRTLPLVA